MKRQFAPICGHIYASRSFGCRGVENSLTFGTIFLPHHFEERHEHLLMNENLIIYDKYHYSSADEGITDVFFRNAS